jgi:type 1 glutamine amidotransferase
MNRSVLMVSDGIVHPSLAARYALRKVLAVGRHYHVKRVASLEILPGMNLAPYRALALFFQHRELSPQALKCLGDFVEQGGGLMAIHSAAASFTQEPAYAEILGGRFVSHGPVQTFRVLPAAPQDEIFGHVPAFLVRDELYRHTYDPEDRVHFYTLVGEQREPVVWTRRYGQGRVCYCSLGHVAGSFRKRPVRRILQRGLAWICRHQD